MLSLPARSAPSRAAAPSTSATSARCWSRRRGRPGRCSWEASISGGETSPPEPAGAGYHPPVTETPATGYLYDQAWEQDLQRLEAIAAPNDDGARRHIRD